MRAGSASIDPKVNDGTPSGYEAEKPMTISEKRTVTVLLTEEHLLKMIEDHLLMENEIGDRSQGRSHRAKVVGHQLETS